MLKKLSLELSNLRPWGTPKSTPRRVRLQAFTAIELTGVLAVLAILAASVFPNVIRRIDFATWQRETSDLKVMANGLVRTVLTDKQVPASNNIPAKIAAYLNLPVSQVTNTPLQLVRRFLVDPSLNINGGGASGVPIYNQPSTGSATRPTNARMMILSTIAGPAVTTISDSFATIWNTPDGSKPSSWTGKTDDLCIQRVDLGALFHKLYLLNIDRDHDGYYAIEPNAADPSVFVSRNPGENTLTAYVLDGTVLSLYLGGSSDPGALQLRVVLHRDDSYVYQNNRWSRTLSSDQLNLNLDPDSFGWWVNGFLQPPAPLNPKFHATQQAVIDEMYTFMTSYVLWATGDSNHVPVIPPFEGTGQSSAPQYPYYSVLPDSRTSLGSFTGNLINP